MSFLSISHVSKKFGAAIALEDFSMDISKGETIALLGASGCGKTTLLRCLAGFEIPETGSIRMANTLLAGKGQFVRPQNRQVSLLFQDYALFPHLTVGQNIGLGLNKNPDRLTVDELLKTVRMTGFATRYPHQLSGGQQQRVALARALATRPEVLLLDEPFSSLDNLLRAEIRAETAALVRQLGLTTVIVTHDADDAVEMADRIVVMDHGQLVGLGTPVSLYENPGTLLVATLFGEINVLEKNTDVCRAIRPEHLKLHTDHATERLKVMVRSCIPANGRFRLLLTGEEKEWKAYAEHAVTPGTQLYLTVPEQHIFSVKP